ncbi:MAG: DUF3987 domain-containing protein [Deltaproteobacteria bacterium]|nr:DUF3987 domain-containing protein [Deltaproteobacteria bacterium]
MPCLYGVATVTIDSHITGVAGVTVLFSTVNRERLLRFLLTYESDKFFELTKESWSPENQLVWETTLEHAMAWADAHLSEHGLNPTVLILDKAAQDIFFAWVNYRNSEKNKLPEQLRGFVPKMVGYSLRLAGVLYCLDCFAKNKRLCSVIDAESIQKGIDLAEFYMGHAVTASKTLSTGTEEALPEQTEQTKILISTLEKLRPEVDNGRLAIGFILEHFNKAAPKENQFTVRAFGAFLRSCGLTISKSVYNANGKRAVKCLLWDEKIKLFLRKKPDLSDLSDTPVNSGLAEADIEKTMSDPASLSPARDADKSDKADNISKEKNKNVLPDDVRIEGDAVLI